MTLTITIQEAQFRLSDLIHSLSPGDEVIIVENDRPIAKLSRSEPETRRPCTAGSAQGTKHWMAPDFDAPLEEFEEDME